jgi:midasin
LRNGYWIVLDELNLAPSDVLEALNRLLDDNRELFIPETQETIKPHPHFMLFATQNPAGHYAGRKQLSKAFRNRFLELHFTAIPQSELETILHRKCLIPESYCKKITSVYKQLQATRDGSRIFDGKHVVTLRDLFRWALRKANGYMELAQDGYMLLAERSRKVEEREIILSILEKTLKVKLDMELCYDYQFQVIMKELADNFVNNAKEQLPAIVNQVVWTSSMKKLFVLVYKATIHKEPVLLIGETGCGKTTVCQILATLLGHHLHIVNAHQNSETADFLGSQRPNRQRDQLHLQVVSELNKRLVINAEKPINDCPSNDEMRIALAMLKSITTEEISSLEALFHRCMALFEWHDGPLVQAMRNGDYFLLDEISLADDSVLERLNSVLEPQRLLVLVEKSGCVQEIIAKDSFHFLATMNPGGDYGKKELSPALRNRFTEIWVPSISDKIDLIMIISSRLQIPDSQFWAQKIMKFLYWFSSELGLPLDRIISLRDILAWVNFIITNISIGIKMAYVHGGSMVMVDSLGVNPLFGTIGSTVELANRAREALHLNADLPISHSMNIPNFTTNGRVGIEPFFIGFGSIPVKSINFAINAPTTKLNSMRVLRAMQLSKPILLEGSPGVGKTSLIASISAISGHELVRINLSEQTDLMDLFGSDLPVENKTAEFEW